MNKMQSIIENRRNAQIARRNQLMERWTPYIAKVEQWMNDKQNKTMSVWDKQNIAQCLENSLDQSASMQNSRLMEATSSDNINFLGIQLPIIAALLPSLVLNDVAMVQALDRRQGGIFYMDVKHGTTKGSVTAGDDMIDAQTGRARSLASRRYAMNSVIGESLSDDTLASTRLTGDFEFSSIQLGSVVITDGTETFTDSQRPGQMYSDVQEKPVGYVTEAGLFDVTFAVTPGSAGAVTANYAYNYDKADSGNSLVPEINIDMRSETVVAEDFTLRAKYSLGAALDLEKAHGISLEDELIKYIGGEIKFEIDHHGLDQILEAAQSVGGAQGIAGNGAWAAAPSAGQEWVWKKLEFIDRIEEASNAIFSKTLRGMCNFLTCGNNVARVIKQLPEFKPASNLGKLVPTGPMNIGTLDGKTIVQDPFQDTDTYVAGYRGDNYLMAGFIYAPYIPLFTTPTLMTSDLTSQKGFMSSCGFKKINSGLFTYGTIDTTGLSTGTPQS